MATNNPSGKDSDDVGDDDSVEEPDETTERRKAPSARKLKRERRAAERDHVRQAKAAERDRRRLAKAAEKREKEAAKARAKAERKSKAGDSKDPEGDAADEVEPKTADKPKAEAEAEKPKRHRRPKVERKPQPKPAARGERRGRRGRTDRKGEDDRGRRSRKRSGAGAKATLAKALPARKGKGKDEDEEGAAKPKRAKGERRPAGTLEKAFTQVLAILGAAIAGVVGVVAVVVKALAGPAEKVRRKVGSWIAAVSRVVTPTRGLLLAAVGCALLLGLSQFVDYRGISIGADAYAPGIQSVAPAPEVQREELGSAHSYAMIPVALIAVLVLVVAVRTRRWQLCRLVVLLGLLAVAVAIFVDRPAGLDEGDLNTNFTGVEAKLLGGYWMQIFAGAGLALTSFLLAGEIKREAPARASRKAPRSPRESDRTEGPEDRGKPKRRGLRGRRGPTGAEGAGA